MGTLVQASTVASGSTAPAATIATPQKKTLLLAGGMSNAGVGNNSLTGWTLLGEAGTVGTNIRSVFLFGRISDGTEGTTVTATCTGATVSRLQVLEFSGLHIGDAFSDALTATVTTQPAIAAATSVNNATATVADPISHITPITLISCIAFQGAVTGLAYANSNGLVNVVTDGASDLFGMAHADGQQDTDLGLNSTVTGTWSWTTSRGSGIVSCSLKQAGSQLASMGVT